MNAALGVSEGGSSRFSDLERLVGDGLTHVEMMRGIYESKKVRRPERCLPASLTEVEDEDRLRRLEDPSLPLWRRSLDRRRRGKDEWSNYDWRIQLSADHSSIFTLREDLMESIAGNPMLAAVLAPGPVPDDEDMIWFDFMFLVGTIQNLLDHQNRYGSPMIWTDAYLEVESILLGSEMDCSVGVPLSGVNFTGLGSLDLTENVRLSPIDPELRRSRDVSWSVDPSLVPVLDASHILWVDGVSVSSSAMHQECWGLPGFFESTAVSTTEAHRLFDCIAVVTGECRVPQESLLRPTVDVGWIGPVRLMPVFPLRETLPARQPGLILTSEDTRQIVACFAKLRSTGSRAPHAAAGLRKALGRVDAVDRITDAVAAIERLCLGRHTQTILLRLQSIVPSLLADDDGAEGEEYLRIKRLVSNLYDSRSALAHGALAVPTWAPVVEQAGIATRLLRDLLRSSLLGERQWDQEDLVKGLA